MWICSLGSHYLHSRHGKWWMRLRCGVIHCVYTQGRYFAASKWQGEQFLVWGFVGLCVTWYLMCERGCKESHTRKFGRLKMWLTGFVTWFCGAHMNAINRSEDSRSLHSLAWNVRRATTLKKKKKPKWRWRNEAWQAACFTIQTGLRAVQPAEFMYLEIWHLSEKNV